MGFVLIKLEETLMGRREDNISNKKETDILLRMRSKLLELRLDPLILSLD